jgi:predicted PurR-regulated permease PerM
MVERSDKIEEKFRRSMSIPTGSPTNKPGTTSQQQGTQMWNDVEKKGEKLLSSLTEFQKEVQDTIEQVQQERTEITEDLNGILKKVQNLPKPVSGLTMFFWGVIVGCILGCIGTGYYLLRRVNIRT